MEYKQLSDRQQRDMLRQRQIQFEGEHFNHAVNLQLLEAAREAGDDTEDTVRAIADVKTAMRTIEKAHDQVSQLIADIPEDEPDTPAGDEQADGTTAGEVPEPEFNPIKSRAERRAASRPANVKKATAHAAAHDSTPTE